MDQGAVDFVIVW